LVGQEHILFSRVSTLGSAGESGIHQMELEAISKPAIPDPMNDDPVWEKCRPPLWPRRTIDGGWTNIPSGQTWRRKVNGKWQYKRDA
jgi:hypothetical protein